MNTFVANEVWFQFNFFTWKMSWPITISQIAYPFHHWLTKRLIWILSVDVLELFQSIWSLYPCLHQYHACVRAVASVCPTFCDPEDCSLPGSLSMGFSRGINTRVGFQALPHGILLDPESNPCLLCLLQRLEGSYQ